MESHSKTPLQNALNVLKKIYKFCFAIFFLGMAFTFGNPSIISALSFSALAVLVFPFFEKPLRREFPILNRQRLRHFLYTLLFLTGILVAMPKVESSEAEHSSSVSDSTQRLANDLTTDSISIDKNIPGISPVDIYGNFEKSGFDTHKEIHSDGSIWTNTKENNGIAYTVTTYCENGVNNVTEARFMATRTLPQYNEVTDLKDFLMFACSTVLYEKSERKKINKFIADNYYKDKRSIVISGIRFTMLSPTEFIRQINIERGQ